MLKKKRKKIVIPDENTIQKDGKGEDRGKGGARKKRPANPSSKFRGRGEGENLQNPETAGGHYQNKKSKK